MRKILKLSEKLTILLILASFVNILLPHGVLAVEGLKQANNEALGELRRVVIYDPERVEPEYVTASTRYITVTAYTSCVYETDSTPFTTANGSVVRDGIIAANFLRFGTKVRFPDYFGDKVFEVHDRMNPRYHYQADIWMEEKIQAKQFGSRVLKMEILEEALVDELALK
ncbi:3D domain-containing protein [Patescibacteria group bacterium]|nr:3D domain-containing protein [Patescibacteria group bacterium]MBU4512230.1 3D domain-containing protein [Patescibacteria group bacterium]MCG2692648.1 3D domain-containing protein [Candidatus Parcubacteria bacterium]